MSQFPFSLLHSHHISHPNITSTPSPHPPLPCCIPTSLPHPPFVYHIISTSSPHPPLPHPIFFLLFTKLPAQHRINTSFSLTSSVALVSSNQGAHCPSFACKLSLYTRRGSRITLLVCQFPTHSLPAPVKQVPHLILQANL